MKYEDFAKQFEEESKNRPLRKALGVSRIENPSDLIKALEAQLTDSLPQAVTFFFSRLKKCELEVRSYDRQAAGMGSLNSEELERLQTFLSDAGLAYKIETRDTNSEGCFRNWDEYLVIEGVTKEEALQKLNAKYPGQSSKAGSSPV